MKTMITEVLGLAIKDIEREDYDCALARLRRLRDVFKGCKIEWGERQ